jgi:hypothetical protein
MTFDAMKPFSDVQYESFIAGLSDSTVTNLRAGKGAAEIRDAVLGYIEKAYAAHLSAGEIIDFFCVSDRCIVDRLVLSEREADCLVSLFDQLHDEFIAQGRRS